MPYQYPNDVPDYIQSLPAGAQKLFIRAWNENYRKTESEDAARIAAWGAVKQEFEKIGDEWKKKGNAMYEVCANAGKARIEKFDGRDHLVIPVVAVKEMVLHGDGGYEKGPEYLPAGEIESSVHLWEGMPIPVEHPDGSARTRNVMESRNVGHLWDVKYEGGKLKGDVWIDIDKANRIGQAELIEKLKNGQLVDVSTAYYANVDYEDGDFGGKSYAGVQRGIVPDHLAILPDNPGACSLTDGCGLNQNEKNLAQKVFEYVTNKITGGGMEKNERKQLIERLVANEAVTIEKDCLEKMTDEALENIEKLAQNQADTEPEPKPESSENVTREAVLNALDMSENEFLALKNEREAKKNAEDKERGELVKWLTENQATNFAKEQLENKSVEDLREFKRMAGGAVYVSGGAPVENENRVPDPEPVLTAKKEDNDG